MDQAFLIAIDFIAGARDVDEVKLGTRVVYPFLQLVDNLLQLQTQVSRIRITVGTGEDYKVLLSILNVDIFQHAPSSSLFPLPNFFLFLVVQVRYAMFEEEVEIEVTAVDVNNKKEIQKNTWATILVRQELYRIGLIGELSFHMPLGIRHWGKWECVGTANECGLKKETVSVPGISFSLSRLICGGDGQGREAAPVSFS